MDAADLQAAEGLIGSQTLQHLPPSAETAGGASEQASPDYTPSDPSFSSQVQFGMMGDIQAVWNDYTGAGVHVGIYDTGVDLAHPDLAANYDASLQFTYNGVTYSGSYAQPPADTASENGHGTHVAGIIAGNAGGVNGVGVAFGASITAINIYDSTSPLFINGTNLTGFYAAAAAADRFDVINNSWGGSGRFTNSHGSTVSTAFGTKVLASWGHALADGRGGLGTVVVKAAGNDANDMAGEGAQNSLGTVMVAAADETGQHAAYFSNFGSNILVTAPGTNILSTDLRGAEGFEAGDHSTISGTSMATPVVVGVAALMLDANPDLGWRDVQTILANSSTHIGSAIGATATGLNEHNLWLYNGASTWNGGGMHFDNDYGYGIVNAFAAVRMAEVWSMMSPTAATSANLATVSASRVTDGTLLGATFDKSYTFNVTDHLDIEHLDLKLDTKEQRQWEFNVWVTSPDGTTVELSTSSPSAIVGGGVQVGINSNEGSWAYGAQAFRGEDSAGTWTVRIQDVHNSAGDFSNRQNAVNWLDLSFSGSAPSSDTIYTYTDEYGGVATGSRATLFDTDGGTDSLNAVAVTTSSFIDLTGSTASTIAGYGLQITGGEIEKAFAGDGDDTIVGTTADNTLWGGRGDDTLAGGGGQDDLIGGQGNDVARFLTEGAGITIDLRNGDGVYTTGEGAQTLVGIEGVIGTAFADSLTGTDGDNLLSVGQGGNDTLDGLGGVNTLSFGDVQNQDSQGVTAALGQDGLVQDTGVGLMVLSHFTNVLGSQYADDITGDAQNNTFRVGAGGADTFDGGAGIDTLSYAKTHQGVAVSLGDGDPQDTGVGVAVLSNFEVLEGTAFADRLTGSAADDTVISGGGDDTLNGGGGVDTLDYSKAGRSVSVNLGTAGAQSTGVGAQHITGFENLVGSALNDSLFGSGSDNDLQGGAGDDTLGGQGGHDILDGGDGIDTADLRSEQGHIDMSLDGVAQAVSDGEITLIGIENLIASSGDDSIHGSDGDNVIEGAGGTDTIDGAGGVDTISYAHHLGGGIYVSLGLQGASQTIASGVDQTLSNFENVLGSSYADTLSGGNGNNSLNGGAGDDVFHLSGGADTLDGGAGVNTLDLSDQAGGLTVDLSNTLGETLGASTVALSNIQNVIGTSGDDQLTGTVEANLLQGMDGADTLFATASLDTLDGGAGVDTANFTLSNYGLDIDLGAQTAYIDTTLKQMVSIENLVASTYADTIHGSSRAERISGGAGNDSVFASLGQDTIDGGAGVRDALSFSAATSSVIVDQGDTSLQSVGGGFDLQQFTGFESILGSDFNDVLSDDTGDGTIDGGAGDDLLLAHGGNLDDDYHGAAGVDTLSYVEATKGVRVTLATQYAYQDSGYGKVWLQDVENLTGSAYADKLTGSTGVNVISGGQGGDDTLIGNGGADTVSYAEASAGVTFSLAAQGGVQVTGVGSQRVSGFANVVGSSYADVLSGDANANVISGGTGGADTLGGGDGSDTVSYAQASAGVSVSLAAQGVVQITGVGAQLLTGFESLIGSAGADALRDDSASNLVDGGAGDDTIVSIGGADTLTGGAGLNTLSYEDAVSAVHVQLLLQGATQDTGVGLQLLTGFTNLTGSQYGDSLVGTYGGGKIDGRGGDDTIRGLGGADTLDGGSGADTVSFGGLGADLHVSLADQGGAQETGAGLALLWNFENLVGGAGSDWLEGDAGGNLLKGAGGADTLVATLGADTLDGGAGRNTADFSNLNDVVVSLSGVGAQMLGAGAVTLLNIDNLTGGAGDDRLTGSRSSNLLDGGDGADTLVSSAGADTLDGGAGVDTVSYALSSQRISVNLAQQDVGQSTGDGLQTLSGLENLVGSSQADVLSGDSDANSILGGGGYDVLSGGMGADTLVGGVGLDHLSGGGDADTLLSLGDGDGLNGGGGADVFVFTELLRAASGTIEDLEQADQIDFTALDGGLGLSEVNRFDAEGAGEFTIKFQAHKGQTLIKIDLDGDGKVDHQIVLANGDHSDFSNFAT